MLVALAPRVFSPQVPRAQQAQVEMRVDTVEAVAQDTMAVEDRVPPRVLVRAEVEDPRW